jgi:hypothetical protein
MSEFDIRAQGIRELVGQLSGAISRRWSWRAN